MSWPAPIDAVPDVWRPELLTALAVSLFVTRRIMNATGAAMTAGDGPGIIQFELAGSTSRATRILHRWGSAGRAAARRSLWVDYLFIAEYVAFLSVCTLALSGEFDGAGRTVGIVVAWGVAAAGALDCLEDVALFAVLRGHEKVLVQIRLQHVEVHDQLIEFDETILTEVLDDVHPRQPWPRIAQVCALVKFAGLIAAIVYIMASVLVVLFR